MKRFQTILLLAILFILNSLPSQAIVLTVSNHPAGGSQYSNLQDAFTAANSGDTIMLEGSNTAYFLNLNCYGDWYKPLVVIGHGFNPQKQMPRTSKISLTGSCHGQFQFGANSGGTKFFGIEFLNSVGLSGTNINNISFYNCKFNSTFTLGNNSSNILYKNCIFIYTGPCLTTNGIANLLITNCIFNGYIEGSSNANSNMLVNHSLFLFNSNPIFSGVIGSIISNSIFMNTNSIGNVTNSEWNNNLFRTLPNYPAGSGNTGSGNIGNSDPLFVNYSFYTYYDTSHNYHTQVGSPVTLAGNDGTDIGLHGGTAKFSESGEPLIAPVIRSMNINQAVISPNSTINVQVNITKPNDQ